MSPVEELKLIQLGSGSLLHSTAQIIFMLGIWTAARGLDPLRTKNKHLQFEEDRTVCGLQRPRITHCFVTDKTHKDAEKVKISHAQSLEKSIECGCPTGTDHSRTNISCQITCVQSFFAFKQPLWENFYDKMSQQGRTNDQIDKLWG